MGTSMIRSIVCTLLVITCGQHLAWSQMPYTIEWQRCLGGSAQEAAEAICSTNDGGFVIAGNTFSTDGDVGGPHNGLIDLWVVKLDSTGDLLWEHCYGGSGMEVGRSVQQTSDGGYIVTGYTTSNDGDVTGYHGGTDIWVLKLGAMGQMEWQRCLGGSMADMAWCVTEAPDGGYVVAGQTDSNDGDLSGTAGGQDAWLVKLTPEGDLEWQRCYGGPGQEHARSIAPATEGGFVVVGSSNSNNTPPVGGGSYGAQNVWVYKIDPSGELEWEWFFGGPNYDLGRGLVRLSDNGYAVIGTTSSIAGGGGCSMGGDDFWLLKLDPTGALEWDRCFGGSADDRAYAVQSSSQGNILLTGTTYSTDGDVSGNQGSLDGWVLEVGMVGELLWQRCLGGSMSDLLGAMSSADETGFVVAGYTTSTNGDVSGHHGGSTDVWVVKLAPLTTGTPTSEAPSTLTLFPNPTTSTLHIQWSGPAPSTLEVLDMTGRLVYGPVVPGNMGEAGGALPVGALPAGLYAVRVQSATGISVQRFVKE
jgi:hypothetical protein